MRHDERVKRIAAEVRARAEAKRRGAGGFASLGKAAVSHMVPNPHDPRHADRKIDVRDLAEILEIDPDARTCTAEPGVTFSDLVRATLPLGLVPTLVPELKTITVGGAVSGCSVESLSYRYGGFHDGSLEYEIVTGTGEALRCSREENADIFDMVHASYGTLGIITRLKFRLIRALPFVRVEYRTFRAFDEFRAALLERCGSGGAGAGGDHDFVDAIAHARDRFVLCLGRFVERAPFVSDYTRLRPFYVSTLERTEDYLTTYDYFFRYDTDAHWLTKTLPGMSSKLGRLLLGRFLLGSTNLLRWSERLRPILRYERHPPVVVDLFIPSTRFADFYAWYERAIDFYPLWIVPYRVPGAGPYPWIAKEHAAKMAGDPLFIDCAVYGKRNDVPGVNYYQLMEEKVRELGGIKALISENFYDEATFWSIFHRANYERVKGRTDPENLFRTLYEKFCFQGAAASRRPSLGSPLEGRGRGGAPGADRRDVARV